MGYQDRTRLKWISCVILLILCFFLERCVMNRIPLWNSVPTLMPLAVSAVGFWEGSFAGALTGLLTGLCSGLVLGPEAYYQIWSFALCGFACGCTIDHPLGRSFPGFLLCSLGVMLLQEGMQLFSRILLLHQPAEAVLSIALGEAGYSLLFVPLLYLCSWQIYERFRLERKY